MEFWPSKSLQQLFPPKPFAYLEGLDAFRFFFKLKFKNETQHLLISAAIISVFSYLYVPRYRLGE